MTGGVIPPGDPGRGVLGRTVCGKAVLAGEPDPIDIVTDAGVRLEGAEPTFPLRARLSRTLRATCAGSLDIPDAGELAPSEAMPLGRAPVGDAELCNFDKRTDILVVVKKRKKIILCETCVIIYLNTNICQHIFVLCSKNLYVRMLTQRQELRG